MNDHDRKSIWYLKWIQLRSFSWNLQVIANIIDNMFVFIGSNIMSKDKKLKDRLLQKNCGFFPNLHPDLSLVNHCPWYAMSTAIVRKLSCHQTKDRRFWRLEAGGCIILKIERKNNFLQDKLYKVGYRDVQPSKNKMARIESRYFAFRAICYEKAPRTERPMGGVIR